MLNLAEQYAKLKKTKILAHKEQADKIIFVLASGPKLTMTEDKLKTEIAAIKSAISKEAPDLEEPKPKKTAASKSKSKGKK